MFGDGETLSAEIGSKESKVGVTLTASSGYPSLVTSYNREDLETTRKYPKHYSTVLSSSQAKRVTVIFGRRIAPNRKTQHWNESKETELKAWEAMWTEFMDSLAQNPVKFEDGVPELHEVAQFTKLQTRVVEHFADPRNGEQLQLIAAQLVASLFYFNEERTDAPTQDNGSFLVRAHHLIANTSTTPPRRQAPIDIRG
ncbi:hypothetical protein BDZ91DRAFT_838385 [Kalaharituber pfeilii]|nr:hypothetical protein BDZ91DRAFT_838385 [Kalaharituber pfeilii]